MQTDTLKRNIKVGKYAINSRKHLLGNKLTAGSVMKIMLQTTMREYREKKLQSQKKEGRFKKGAL